MADDRAATPVVGLVTLQFSSGGLFDSQPADDYAVHLVTATAKGTPGPTLCGLDRFHPKSAGWSVGGGTSGPGIVHKPCPGCAEAARTRFPGLEVTGLGAKEMAGVLGVPSSVWNGGQFKQRGESDDLTATLDGWRKIEQAATPGPWEADVIEELGDRPVVLLPVPGNDDAADLLFQADAPQATEADAEFIATARTAMPLLVAAVEAVLKPHRPGRAKILGRLCQRHENHRFFSITRTEADDVRACPDCTATVYTSCTGCGSQVRADACPVREVITRELAKGEGNRDDHAQ